MSIARRMALGAAVPLVLLVVMVQSIENSMIYFPSRYPEGYWSPEVFGVRVEDCYFESEDGVRLHAWYVPSAGARRTLLWCHGNAGNLSGRVDQIKFFLDRVGVNLLIFDYRGYGRSAGEPSEEGLYRDARAAYDYLVKERKIDPSQLVVYGQSLGGAVAVDLAVNHACAGAILEATFTSASDMARAIYPWPVAWLIRTRFDSVEKIPRLRVPLLMLHGDRDQVVPIELGKRLFAAARDPKRFVELPGSDHNDTYLVGDQVYVDAFKQFLHDIE